MLKSLSKKFTIIILIPLFFLSTCGENSNKEKQNLLKSYKYNFIKVNNGKIFYKSFGSGDPIIVVHGGPGLLDHTYLLPQMLELAKDHELIFYDQRGSGQSLETEMNEKYINIKQFVEDIEELRKNLCYKKFTILGHSWGGALAMHYAIAYRENLDNLIILNTASIDHKGNQLFSDSFKERTKPIKAQIAPLFQYDEFKKLNSYQINDLYRTIFSVYFFYSKNVENLTLYINEIASRSGFHAMELMESDSHKLAKNIFPKLRKLAIPTLIIHGDSDIIPYIVAEEIKENIPGAKIIKLEKSGHFSYIENPKETFYAIREFMHNNSEYK